MKSYHCQQSIFKMVAVFLRVLGVYFGLKCLSRLSHYDLTRNQDTVPSPNHFFFIYPPIKLYHEWEVSTAIVCQVSERGVQEPRRTSGNELSGARELDKSVRPRYQCRSRTEYRCESLSADQGPAFSPTRDVIIILYRPTQL